MQEIEKESERSDEVDQVSSSIQENNLVE